jgi:hypothetical protein
MPPGYLATIVATIPEWLDMVVNMDEVDIDPPGGPKFKAQEWKTRRDLLEQFETSLKKGRKVLQKTTDDRQLNTKRRMLGGWPRSRRGSYQFNGARGRWLLGPGQHERPQATRRS